MQEFFMDYGLWLLIGLLIVIGLVFLLSGRRRADETIEPSAAAAPIDPAPAPAPTPFVDPIIAAPVAATPMAVEPAVPVETVTRAEPVAPVARPAPVAPDIVPAPIPVSPPATTIGEDHDDLLRLKGVGPKLRTLLIELGVTRYAQIADWTDADIATIDARLGNFRGRPIRDQWVDQAKYLAAGDIAGFEAKYGKL